MRTAKPEIAANTAVCDGAPGSISGVVDKIREKRALSHCADKKLCRQNAVPPKKRHREAFLTKYNGRARFLSFGERNVRRIFAKQKQSLKCDRVRYDMYKCARAHNVR